MVSIARHSDEAGPPTSWSPAQSPVSKVGQSTEGGEAIALLKQGFMLTPVDNEDQFYFYENDQILYVTIMTDAGSIKLKCSHSIEELVVVHPKFKIAQDPRKTFIQKPL